MPAGRTGVPFSTLPLGAGSSHPKLDQFSNVFRLTVSRSTVAKPNKVDITFMARFVGLCMLKPTCVTDLGYLAG